LRLSDSAFEADCDVSFCQPVSGSLDQPQAGVRIVHRLTGVAATAAERRDHLQNRVMALVLLRERLYSLASFQRPRRFQPIVERQGRQVSG
jgi:protein subunit release factor A